MSTDTDNPMADRQLRVSFRQLISLNTRLLGVPTDESTPSLVARQSGIHGTKRTRIGSKTLVATLSTFTVGLRRSPVSTSISTDSASWVMSGDNLG